MNNSTTHKEVTTIENQMPRQVVTKTTSQAEPQAKGEAPQRVFDKKKTIFRFNQIIWYVLGFVEVLLGFRFALKALGANPLSGFASLIYAITTPLTIPFNGILGISSTGNSMLDTSALIAAIVYLCIAWGLVYFLNIVYPITPSDVEVNNL